MIPSAAAKADLFIRENKDFLNREFRLNYHLMGEYGWINDPNGFIQYQGRYHLFYQHYPYKAVWGPMHWGHAVSEDLVRWNYLPVALAPDHSFDRDGCFSGSAIEKDGRLYLMYTGHVYTKEGIDENYTQTQCLAYSKDGITFVKHEDNPVISTGNIPEGASKKDFRDPKVFKNGENYYAVLGSSDLSGNGQVLLYRSKDLTTWEFVNTLAKSTWQMRGTWECPDLFQLQDRDILMVSPQYLLARGIDFNNLHSTIYMIGDSDLEKGVFEYNDFYPVDYGFDFYAPQTALDQKGRRVVIGWMDMWDTPMPTQDLGHNWAGAMTLPREAILKGQRVFFRPLEELRKYRKDEYTLSPMKLNGEKCINATGDSYEIQATFHAGQAVEFGLKLRVNDNEETVLSYDRGNHLFTLNRDKSGMGPKGERRTRIDLIDDKLAMQVFVDKSSVEVFLNEGEKVMSARIYPSRDSLKIKAFSKGECDIIELKKWDIGRVI